jgi:S-methylmethionine-dependent homocysteine/selenocysteine methylase
MAFEWIRRRLESGRPLVLDADCGASLRARGHALDVPGALGQLLRERPEEVLSHHVQEVGNRVDILTALTADTTPRALSEVGMQHRAAALTGLAVELALEAARNSHRPVVVAGALGSDMVGPVASDRVHQELAEHAARLHAASTELVIARGQGSRFGLLAAVTAAARTKIPTWAVIEYDAEAASEPMLERDLAHALGSAGASVILLEVPSVEIGLRELRRSQEISANAGLTAGVLLAASAHALRGFEEEGSDPEGWVTGALDLTGAGARVIGGGAGTTEGHTRSLATSLGILHPSMPPAESAPVS